MAKQDKVPPTFERPQEQVVQIAPLEIQFNTSQVFVTTVETPQGKARRLTIVHPNGVAAVAIMPLEVAKNIGAQLIAPEVELAPAGAIPRL